MAKYHDSSHGLGDACSTVIRDEPEGGVYEVFVPTDYGFAKVIAFEGNTFSYSRITIIFNGRVYERRYPKAYRQPHLVTLAKRFATELAGLADTPPMCECGFRHWAYGNSLCRSLRHPKPKFGQDLLSLPQGEKVPPIKEDVF